MARTLQFKLKGQLFEFGIQKIDRSKLYGYTETYVVDDQGKECSLASISEDGKHLLSKGCIGYTYLNSKNEYVAQSDIMLVDAAGNPLPKIPSSFDLENIDLKETTIQEYLQLEVKSVYELVSEGTESAAFLEMLREAKILKCTFNYRTDYSEDDAFLIPGEDAVFMVTGTICPFDYIGLELESQLEVATEEEEEEEEDFDFGML